MKLNDQSLPHEYLQGPDDKVVVFLQLRQKGEPYVYAISSLQKNYQKLSGTLNRTVVLSDFPPTASVIVSAAETSVLTPSCDDL
jgi:hypothetical protein